MIEDEQVLKPTLRPIARSCRSSGSICRSRFPSGEGALTRASSHVPGSNQLQSTHQSPKNPKMCWVLPERAALLARINMMAKTTTAVAMVTDNKTHTYLLMLMAMPIMIRSGRCTEHSQGYAMKRG